MRKYIDRESVAAILNSDVVCVDDHEIGIHDDTGFLCLSDLRDLCMKVYYDDSSTEIFPNFGMIVNGLRRSECLRCILEELGVDGYSDMLKDDSESVTKYLTSLGLYKTVGSRAEKKTYCHPYIWLYIAYLMNPRIGEQAQLCFAPSDLLLRIEMCDYLSGMMIDWSLDDLYRLYLWADKHTEIFHGRYPKNGNQYKCCIRELVSHLEFCFEHGFLKSPEECFELLRGEINDAFEP